MASESNFGGGAPNLNLSPEEKRVYGLLFRQADTEGVGVVTGEIAVQFFEKTRLDSRILGEIWQIADRENRGFLEATGFGVALRLIGHAQAGREPTTELALQQGPLPKFDGINIGPAPAPAPAPVPAPAPLQQQASGTGPIRIPPLTPEKVSQYAAIFENQSLQNGILPGGPAKTIFEKSQLPNEVLGRIWQLADTEQRGGLVLTEFVIAMHLLTSMKTGALRALPSILPAALYEAATRRGPPASRQSPVVTGTPVSAIPRQLSGSAQPRTSSPLGRPPFGAQGVGVGVPAQTTGGDWLISPVDKAKYDQFYAELDKANKGYITGEEAVPFLSQSKLSEDALAQIWDLADINSEGRLTKDTFAVAMYLIRQQRTKGGPLPTSLPPGLIPPSLRNRIGPSPFGPSVSAPAPAPEPAPLQPPPQPKSALDDLFGLDASPSPAPASVSLSPQGTGAATKIPAVEGFAGVRGASPIQPSPTGNTFKPFIPSSSFGRTLTAQDTGGSGTSSHAAKAQPSNMEDLLGDNDPEISKKLTNETAELANLSNQIGSLSKQMQQVQGQRSTTQNEINQASEQKRNFEQRLSQLRTLYEKEAKDVQVLEEQLKNIREDTRKLTNEMVSIDGNYQDLLAQHRQLTQALQADQQENATLKQRISGVNSEIAQLKPQIEKLKSEARQQKGLVAINKKQLATVEGERDKLQTEADDLTKSNEELSRQASASSPVAAPAQVASPAPSTTSSSDIMGAFSSPPAKPYSEKAFDDIFGGFVPSTSSATPPPPTTTFKKQNTGNSSASVGSFGTPLGSSPTASRQGTLNADLTPTSESRQPNSTFMSFGETSEPSAPPRQVTSPFPHALEAARTGQSTTSASDANQSLTSAQNESKEAASTNGSAPGAFSDETPTPNAQITSFHNHRDSDPFVGMKDTGNAKMDFDSAFASFPSSSNKSQEKAGKDSSNAFSNFNTEFPPISELEREDESDSASEDNRFDDDFTPASPPRKTAGESDTANTPSSPNATKSTTASPEEASAGENSVAKSHTPQPSNLSGLSAFPEPPKLSPSLPSPTKSGSPFAPASSTTTNTAPVTSKSAFDELDDDFEGLEDAKEGSADDEFANVSRSNLDDFNAVFDSSPPPSQPRTESTNVSNAFGTESSYDFGNISTASTGTASATPIANTSTTAGSAKNPTPPNNDEWDALFTDLPPAKDSTTEKSTEESKSPTQNLSPERPSFAGRALTDEGKHDDPMVKNLTGMGYSRADAVNALEKYDYNLERVG
ncbi:hypothetical protein F5Y07DRAFT_392693 [Xylaria sp. FL0933]|nr:hypothetical protein F5Y07DRAFT_392693 [Xylaria sp. FL0933]